MAGPLLFGRKATALSLEHANEGKQAIEQPLPYGLVGLIASSVLIVIAAGILTGLVAALAFAIFALVLGWRESLVLLTNLPGQAGSESGFLERAGVIVSLVVYAALSCSVFAAARWRGGWNWRALIGWRTWHPLRGAALFWIIVATTIAYGFAADALVAHFYPPSKDWISVPKGVLWTSLFVVLAVVLAPLTEELLFRGWLYTGLRTKLGTAAGNLVTAGLFAGAHWEKTHLYALIVFPVGIMLGIVREKTASLKSSIAFHALFNGTASLALLFGS